MPESDPQGTMNTAARFVTTSALLALLPALAIACDGESTATAPPDGDDPAAPPPGGDTVPPRLVTADFVPKQVSVSPQGGTELVEITATIRDDGEGVTRVLVLFAGPRKARFTQFTELQRVSGDKNSGEFHGSLGIDQSAGTGEWTLILIRADDGAGNTTRYDTQDLEEMGVPVTLRVSG